MCIVLHNSRPRLPPITAEQSGSYHTYSSMQCIKSVWDMPSLMHLKPFYGLLQGQLRQALGAAKRPAPPATSSFDSAVQCTHCSVLVNRAQLLMRRDASVQAVWASLHNAAVQIPVRLVYCPQRADVT
jgi:hypothetical protein